MMIMINNDYDEQTMKMTCDELPVYSEADRGTNKWV